MELSCCKYPASSNLPIYWNANLESLLYYMEDTRRGVYGLVTDKLGNPVKGGVVKVQRRAKWIAVTHRGEYWRLLYPGHYTVEVVAPGYRKETSRVEVTKENPYVRLDFVLTINDFDNAVESVEPLFWK